MWLADIHCDLNWVRERQGNLGPKRMALRGMRSRDLGVAIEMLLYGDESCLRHVRVLIDTDDQQTAETCVDLHIQTWVASVESAVIMMTGRSFTVAHFPRSLMFAVTLGAGDENSPAVVVEVPQEQTPIDYRTLALGIAAWDADVQHHLFYFRRHIDWAYPIDVRWLNGYRLMEWHFCSGQSKLSKSPEWREFLARFDGGITPLLRRGQNAVGLMEEARALAAHAGLDERPSEERKRDPRSVMDKTFPVLERMVMTLLNEHAAGTNSPIRFHTLASPPSETPQPQPGR
jgi:hypothetical protein